MSSARNAAWLTEWEYAHRGLHDAEIPENSLAAAEQAIERGLGIECDVQLSRDNQPMVFHDWELDRLTRHQGLVAARSESELEELHLTPSNERIASLSGLLERVEGRVPLLIEIKSRPDFDARAGVDQIVKVMAAYHGHFALMSFDPRICRHLAEDYPDITRGLVGTDRIPNGFEGMWRQEINSVSFSADFFALDCRDLARVEAQPWREAGHPLLTWTIRDLDERERALALADALISEGRGLA